jgi:hypothetical protein
MRTFASLVFAGVLLLLACACAQQPAQPAAAAPAAAGAPPYTTTATIKDIMDSLVEANADIVFDSVETVIDAKGEHNKMPKTDDEWKAVRRSAVTVMEATNLLMVPGRHVALPGEKPEDANVELGPDQIQALIDGDRQSFYTFAVGLHDAMNDAFVAINNKDSAKLFEVADGIDKACENCHLKYWYPNEKKAIAEEESKKK